MAAPSSTLVDAIRQGTAARHILFRMEHPDGAILAWDGIGPLEYGGETYTGVGNFLEINGASQSWEVQNYHVEVALNGVPVSAFYGTTTKIRGQPASLRAVWLLAESRTILATKILFSGFGNFVTSRVNADTLTIKAALRSKIADWGVVPGWYYTPVDQNRLYEDDTGCSQVQKLENAVIAGWQGTGGGAAPTNLIYYRANLGIARFIADGTDKLFGHPTLGPWFKPSTVGQVRGPEVTSYYADNVNGNRLFFGALGSPLLCNGVSANITGGFVYSADNNLIGRNGSASTAAGLRQIGSIASDGIVTAARCVFDEVLGKYMLCDPNDLPSAVDLTGVAFGADYSTYAYFSREDTSFSPTGFPFPVVYQYKLRRSDGKAYIENTTGHPVLLRNVSGTFQPFVVNMSGGTLIERELRVSGTKKVLSVDGNVIYAQGVSPASSYLRFWT